MRFDFMLSLSFSSTAMPILIILYLFLIPSSFSCVEAFNFSFPSFDSGSCGNNGGSLICMGSVTVGNGSLSITPIDPNTPFNQDTPFNQVGRVLYRRPVIAWPAYISTTFTSRILTDPNSSSRAGDGMAFILAQDSSPSPPESFGSYMGIFDKSTQGVLHLLAVEFDTFKNENDPDANHIAIDTVHIDNPVAAKSLNSTGIVLKSGREITVKIEYDGWTKNLQIYVARAGEPLVSFLNHTIQMKGTVPSSIYAGFTAATGTLRETHQVLSWNFTSTQLPYHSLGIKNKKMSVVVLLAVIVGSLVLSIVGTTFIVRAHRRKRKRLAKKKDIEGLIASSTNGPKLFAYKQLSKATHNFRKENLLGTGGFGSVYKGILSDPHTAIAVKKISSTSRQGEKEYLAEICTIGRLRHKNLLQLQGWCHDRDQLLLVYEYMPNGSLDRFIGKGEFLDWTTRYKILIGLASALVYLHEECGNPVVHRDVKPNNVMLDSNYDAHLGDFGLARLLQNDSSVTTMIAGTPGYLAPEVYFTGRATPESDVYSFGMVVLEVVCGRRTRGLMDENGLVDNAWSCYERGALMECVDKMLEGNVEEEQVRRTLLVGLACLHPNHMSRPRMRKVVHIFMNPDEPLMNLPETRPIAVCLSFNSNLNPSTTIDFCYSSPRCGVHTETLKDEI